jgi:hypothetical protein
MHKQMQEQKKQISEKEALIRVKQAELKITEEEYEKKFKGLNLVYESEKKKKNDLEMNLKVVNRTSRTLRLSSPKRFRKSCGRSLSPNV